jgi:hypothetical protein
MPEEVCLLVAVVIVIVLYTQCDWTDKNIISTLFYTGGLGIVVLHVMVPQP